MLLDDGSNRFRHQDGNGVPHLLVLGDAGPKKPIAIRERLQTRSFSNCEGAILVGQENGTPMRIALRHYGSCKAIRTKPSIALSVV